MKRRVTVDTVIDGSTRRYGEIRANAAQRADEEKFYFVVATASATLTSRPPEARHAAIRAAVVEAAIKLAGWAHDTDIEVIG